MLDIISKLLQVQERDQRLRSLQKDLKDIPKRVLKVMKIHAVEHMDDVLRVALAHAEPDKFLPGPSEAVDWRTDPRARRERDATTPARSDESADGGSPATPATPVPGPATVMHPERSS